MEEETFFDKLKEKMDKYAHLIYRFSSSFPKDEIFGVTSQIRRAGLSVVLNYIEGFARIKRLVKLNFWEISYGLLKESKYLLHFSLVERYISKNDYTEALSLADEIGAMLWRAMESVRKE